MHDQATSGAKATSGADCIPHEGHGDHAHDEECGHAALAHEEHTDYIHDTHRHARHDGHWDEHSLVATMTGTPVGRPGGAG